MGEDVVLVKSVRLCYPRRPALWLQGVLLWTVFVDSLQGHVVQLFHIQVLPGDAVHTFANRVVQVDQFMLVKTDWELWPWKVNCSLVLGIG